MRVDADYAAETAGRLEPDSVIVLDDGTETSVEAAIGDINRAIALLANLVWQPKQANRIDDERHVNSILTDLEQVTLLIHFFASRCTCS